ncbi:hypothetical protein LEMA_P106330.1 [Plenodomus lingam JN3]|uniref:FHF complex subunit HOOK-interacting protein C-terminal domain-containing protein n=1 Tax=Leptosphaeria maculans (strain JN3 / isolate v23.1.3 / race Av1-4-5-6-7-8) TaxID=985895 RepID=E5A146_LEPMJ|nr:hypothetical protein LEMA_P106330.1 [Plenodomus lingam JN3]CBX97502.1 hypothetical protein LEMA_P106330.1 [Plenodomus lingam JN3]
MLQTRLYKSCPSQVADLFCVETAQGEWGSLCGEESEVIGQTLMSPHWHASTDTTPASLDPTFRVPASQCGVKNKSSFHMDFWVRLLGGSSQKKRAAPNNPQQRLARFRQQYNQILQTWQKSTNLAHDREALTNIRRSFQALSSILNDESRSPAPHMCLQFAAAQQIYTAVSKIAATSHDEGVVRDAVAFYNALIDSEEEDFLENDVFAVSLMNFIDRTVGSGSMGVGEDIEADIVELLFGIAAKIRLQPEILPVWFTTSAPADAKARVVNQKVDFAGVTQKEDFPLCYQLIDHVHHEGRIGDFARTGLLYIFESASRSITLEQWIVNSDLPTLMATGLGALYSQMSRKLSIQHPAEDMPLVLSLSDYADLPPNPQAENFFGADFQNHLSTFLSYLTFWQDVLEHCRSIDVRHTLIDHFQILFLQQLLYPSLLESSDADGGSSVAVLTYLRHILDALDHPELVHMILQYLLALLDYTTGTSREPRSPAAIKKRQSLILLNSAKEDEDRLNPSLFNLVDLILGSTSSTSPQTITAALKLTTVILGKNHAYALGSLVKVMNIHRTEPHRTAGALNKELETYLNLGISLAGLEGVDEAYENYLKDVLSLLESHPCSLNTISLPGASSKNQSYFDSSEVPTRDVDPHYLLPEDPLFQTLTDLLLTFLTNDIETNLALTEAIVSLGTCSQLCLEGWLCVDPADYHFDANSPEPPFLSNENLRNMYLAERAPSWSPSATPQLLSCLTELQRQIEALRADIPDWDEHVASRKTAFRLHEKMLEEIKSGKLRRTSESIIGNIPGGWAPQIPHHVRGGEGGVVGSRAQSPRGRKEALSERRNSPGMSGERGSSRFGGSGTMTTTAMGSPGRGVSPGTLGTQGSQRGGGGVLEDIDANLKGLKDAVLMKRRIRFRRVKGENKVEVLLSKYQPPPKDRDAPSHPKPKSEAQGSGDSTAATETGGQGDGAVVAESGEQRSKQDEEAQRGHVHDNNDDDEADYDDADTQEASLMHIITNVVVLQDFVLELVALVQVRASLFGEVRFA